MDSDSGSSDDSESSSDPHAVSLEENIAQTQAMLDNDEEVWLIDKEKKTLFLLLSPDADAGNPSAS
jgi:hypothetical protein